MTNKLETFINTPVSEVVIEWQFERVLIKNKLYMVLVMWKIVGVVGRGKIQWCHRAWYMGVEIQREVLVCG